jgi:D-alanyl-D-alanine carboxypeptidase
MGPEIHTYLEDFRAKHRPPALGAAIVTRGGDLELDVIGERVRGGGDPVRPEDRWHIGSCGKSITATLYARLVERGDAQWNVSVAELFSDLSVDAGWREVTVDDVFVCQAGLPANLTRANMVAAWKDTKPLPDQRTEVSAVALARAPRRPGRFLYSNLGYIVIGAAIERITRLPFESAISKHVLEPLEIHSGGFGPPTDVWGHGGKMLALGPIMLSGGRSTPGDPERAESDNPAVMSPAGRLHLSLEDWAKFQRVFLTDGGDFLSSESIERLLTPAPDGGQRMAYGWAAARTKLDASMGQQGSNTLWVATAIMSRKRERTVMIVTNEGRARLLRKTPVLAVNMLSDRTNRV